MRSPVTSSFDTTTFRRVLGRLPTGVAVITAVGPDGVPVGMTCNSFTSVSLDPPLVLFCVARVSRTWPHLQAAGVFCVNVLASHHDAVSDRFASRVGDRFAGARWVTRPAGMGLLDAISWIDCTIVSEYDGGDHVIVVGRVLELQNLDDESQPLIFHRGEYGTVSSREPSLG